MSGQVEEFALNEIEDTEKAMKESFFSVLSHREIRTVFQPIISLRDGAVFGYEALSRGPVGSAMHAPEMLFSQAEKYNQLWELESLCRTTALQAVAEIGAEHKLFLNVNPNIMHDIKFKQGFTREYLEKFSINPERIIFEITEREAICNMDDFIKTVQNYKDQNYKIAIDDAGAGYSGLNVISDIRPHFIKLDMKIIRDIDKDVTKQSLAKSMCEFASLTNTLIIAEGIETEGELLKLIEIGVHYGQGFLIQRPNAAILPPNNQIIKIIHTENSRKNHFFGGHVSDVYVNNICRPLGTINQNILVQQVDEMIKNDPAWHGYCVTDDLQVIGVITRSEFYKHLSGRYGYTLHANKPIKYIMSTDFMSVDYQTTIDVVAKIAMQREFEKIYDFITVTQYGKYLGIVTVKELLERTIDIEVLNAKHLNPLSELPGNVLVEKHLEKSVHTPEFNYVLYFDLDNFKPYNDVYGFENGDRVLKCLTRIIKENIPLGGFVGHIGGDDFVAILIDQNPEGICTKIIRSFDKEILNYYNQDDINRGFIIARNRHEVEESYPLLSISIAGVASKQYANIYDLTEDIARLKKLCKQKTGSNFLFKMSVNGSTNSLSYHCNLKNSALNKSGAAIGAVLLSPDHPDVINCCLCS